MYTFFFFAPVHKAWCPLPELHSPSAVPESWALATTFCVSSSSLKGRPASSSFSELFWDSYHLGKVLRTSSFSFLSVFTPAVPLSPGDLPPLPLSVPDDSLKSTSSKSHLHHSPNG